MSQDFILHIYTMFQKCGFNSKKKFQKPGVHLTLRWSPGELENSKEVSLSYKSTNRRKHSTNKDTNRLPHVSKLQVTTAELITDITFPQKNSNFYFIGISFYYTINVVQER